MVSRANFPLAALVGMGLWLSAATILAQAAAGVAVDAEGVLRVQTVTDPTGAVQRQRIQAAQAALDPKLAAKSPLRKISLQRLEKAVEGQLAADRKPTDEMRYLAGLTRVQYVFFYPESGDIVIAGPAEGWAEDLAGRVRGIHSGRPVVELQDLVVALRTFAPDQPRDQAIGCSIDPTQEGLARMQQFLRSLGLAGSALADRVHRPRAAHQPRVCRPCGSWACRRIRTSHK